MNPESTSSERDALALIAGIERASRRSRPFFLFGLLAVILGFVSVSVYLYQDREEERAQRAVLEKQVARLSRTLSEARTLLPNLDDSARARDRMRVLLGQASATARALPAAVAAAESGTPAAAATPPPAATRTPAASPRPETATPPTPPEPAQSQPAPPARPNYNEIRFRIYISDQTQFAMARELEWRLRGGRPARFTVGDVRVIQGSGRGNDNLLICHNMLDCERWDAVADYVHSMLLSPRLTKRGIGVIQNRDVGLFEIWLAPGQIRVVSF